MVRSLLFTAAYDFFASSDLHAYIQQKPFMVGLGLWGVLVNSSTMGAVDSNGNKLAIGWESIHSNWGCIRDRFGFKWSRSRIFWCMLTFHIDEFTFCLCQNHEALVYIPTLREGGGGSKGNINYIGLSLIHNIYNPYWLAVFVCLFGTNWLNWIVGI